MQTEDIVHYGLPFGPLGRFAHFLFVRQLKRIFDLLERYLAEHFGNTAHDS